MDYMAATQSSIEANLGDTSGRSSVCNRALFTDLYELTMAQAYQTEGMDQLGVFELAFREMPRNRNYIVAAGFQDVLDFLTAFHFSAEELDYLRGNGEFSEAFLKGLERLRFTGDVYAVPEGTLVFPNEPLLQVIAPIAEAQLIETRGRIFRSRQVTRTPKC
jgi:nicotinate phosphoribosyltransferase